MGLPVHTLQPDDRVRILPRLLCLLLACIAGLWISTGRFYTVESESLSSMERICPQQPEYDPTEALQKLSIRPPSVLHSVKLLSEAVQLSTEAMDEILSDDEELESVTRNATFSPFSDWIEKSFPFIHAPDSPVRREFVNKHGLLYTWEGTNPSLKPVVLMAHQDTVPVNIYTLDRWIHPPFSGYIDLENQTVWGRGSLDCKLWLVASLSAVETLVQAHFQPKRTIILSYGFDEETDGKYGAAHLASTLLYRYGPNSLAMIVDEGSPVLSAIDPGSYGLPIAGPAVAERGELSMRITVHARGGHSSMPPPHTGIGILALIIAKLEANPFPDVLGEESRASILQLQCLRDAPKMPAALRRALRRVESAERTRKECRKPCWQHWWKHIGMLSRQRRLDAARNELMQSLDYASRMLLKTTQAVDVAYGGIKVNALPEISEAFVNHRIAPYASMRTVIQHYKDLLVPLAKEYGFSLIVDRDDLNLSLDKSTVSVNISKTGLGYDSHPPSPFEGEKAEAWRLLSSVIRQTWHTDEPRIELRSMDDESVPEQRKYIEPVRVAPSIMFANTDTRWFHDLTTNIFRFGATSVHPDLTGMSPYLNVHTVNEHVSIDSVVKATQFYTNLLVAADHEQIERV